MRLENHNSPSVTIIKRWTFPCFLTGAILGILFFGVWCVHNGEIPACITALHDRIFSTQTSSPCPSDGGDARCTQTRHIAYPSIARRSGSRLEASDSGDVEPPADP